MLFLGIENWNNVFGEALPLELTSQIKIGNLQIGAKCAPSQDFTLNLSTPNSLASLKYRLAKEKHFYSHYKISPFVTPEEHLQYKYLVCLDGNTCTYPGLQWRLQSNSLVFKPKSNEMQWYYEGLVPNYHYLALDRDCANLISKLQWARQNDHLAHQIARQSTKFANEHLSQPAIYHYLTLLLREYETIQVTHNLALDSTIHEYTPFCRY